MKTIFVSHSGFKEIFVIRVQWGGVNTDKIVCVLFFLALFAPSQVFLLQEKGRLPTIAHENISRFRNILPSGITTTKLEITIAKKSFTTIDYW